MIQNKRRVSSGWSMQGVHGDEEKKGCRAFPSPFQSLSSQPRWFLSVQKPECKWKQSKNVQRLQKPLCEIWAGPEVLLLLSPLTHLLPASARAASPVPCAVWAPALSAGWSKPREGNKINENMPESKQKDKTSKIKAYTRLKSTRT